MWLSDLLQIFGVRARGSGHRKSLFNRHKQRKNGEKIQNSQEVGLTSNNRHITELAAR